MERFIGSPGGVHVGVGGTTRTFAIKHPLRSPLQVLSFNEVRNDTSDANLDWIELHYHADIAATTAATAQNLENWTVSIVTATKADDGTYSAPVDANLFSLPKYKLQPGEYLVVYNRDPGDTILAGGVNIEDVAAGTQVNKGSSHLYVVRDGLTLPSDKKFLLLLRNGNDKVNTHEKLVDYAGNGFFSVSTLAKYNTDIHGRSSHGVFPAIGMTQAKAIPSLLPLPLVPVPGDGKRISQLTVYIVRIPVPITECTKMTGQISGL